MTAQACLKSWKKFLPGFKVILWNEENSPMSHPFVSQAYEARKYAFVADYVRFWAIYEHGGLYLDTDMLMLRTLDTGFLKQPFLGKEDQNNLNGCIMGFPRNHPFIYDCLKFYQTTQIRIDELVEIAIPKVLTNVYSGYELKLELKIYEPEVFYSYPFTARTKGDLDFRRYITSNSYGVHLWDGSWIDGFQDELGSPQVSKRSFYIQLIKNRLKAILGR